MQIPVIPDMETILKKHAIHNFDRVPMIQKFKSQDYVLTRDRMLITKETFDILKELVNGYKTISLWAKTNWLETHLCKWASVRSFDDPDTVMPKTYGEVTKEEFIRWAKEEFEAAELILIKDGTASNLQRIQPYLLKSHKVLTYTNLGSILHEGGSKELREVDELNKVQVRFPNDVKHRWIFHKVV